MSFLSLHGGNRRFRHQEIVRQRCEYISRLALTAKAQCQELVRELVVTEHILCLIRI